MDKEAVTVRDFYDYGCSSLRLKVVSGEEHLDRAIPEEALNRPGLALAGFFQYFAHRRIQVIGLAENSYLKSLNEPDRLTRLQHFFEKQIPCVVVTRNRHASADALRLAKQHRVPLLRTSMITSRFINEATMIMENLASPQIRVQGTMVDVMGVGVLIEGEPGIGKSETALALVERGHSLVADDITVLRKGGWRGIVGTSVDVTRFHMEIRGLGFIHVPSLFGVASMRNEASLDLIIRLERLRPGADLDRTGLDQKSRPVLGQDIPLITLPVAAGRDMSQIVEVAALNQKLKGLGRDAAVHLNETIVANLDAKGKELEKQKE